LHTPLEHVCPDGHTLPHAPQFVALVIALTSQPSLATPLQSRKPELQA